MKSSYLVSKRCTNMYLSEGMKSLHLCLSLQEDWIPGLSLVWESASKGGFGNGRRGIPGPVRGGLSFSSSEAAPPYQGRYPPPATAASCYIFPTTLFPVFL